jgi:hypothetical protein
MLTELNDQRIQKKLSLLKNDEEWRGEFHV